MKIVEIINGSYGYKAPGAKYVELKSIGDRFEETDEKADRLVRLGVGRIIKEEVEESATKAQTHEADDSIDSLSKAELKALAESIGISVRDRASKAELLEAIKEADGGFPELKTEEPV